MSQVTEQSVRFQTALASIKLIQASAVLDLTEDDFDFLTSNKVWIATDRSRARRCVEACVYGTLDFVGYPRFPAPVEFIAAVIAYYVHPVNIQTACLIMEGAEFTENIINGVERPVKAAELFAFTFVYAQETLTFIRHNLSSSKGPKPLQLKLLTTYIPKTSAFTLAFSTSQRLRTTRASARTFFTFRHYITPSARNF